MINFDEIVLEWSYRLKDGIPDVTDSDKVLVLNEILLEKGISSKDLFLFAEKMNAVNPNSKKLPRPNTGANKTDLKEGLVCLFFDCFKEEGLKKSILDIQNKIITKKWNDLSSKEVDSTVKKISSIFSHNVKNYGDGISTPKNLDQYLHWVWQTGEEALTVNNAMSSANAIISSISNAKKATVIRNKTFTSIRSKAVELIKKDYQITLTPDNWCPGDIYLIVDSSATNQALDAETVNIGKKSINGSFSKDHKIIAVSCKEQEAQAGKATTFTNTVFKKSFDGNLKHEDKFGSSDNKDVAKLTAYIKRFTDYFYGEGKGTKPRPQSYIRSISNGPRIHKSVNGILKAAGKPLLKSTDIEFTPDEKKFHEKNKKVFDSLLDAIKQVRAKLKHSDTSSKINTQFVSSRNKFIKYLGDFKVKVDAMNSNQFLKIVNEKNEEDPAKIKSMKISTYELATTLMEKWVDKNSEISPAYKKISEITNPFVALTAFAIAEAGISPSFWKVIGSEKAAEGHADYFDAMAAVDIDTTTSPIKLYDSATAAGFNLIYITKVGTKQYKTILSFRFSNDQIRIEVSEFKKI